MVARLLAPPARFVLGIGNEGAVLIHLAGGRIRGRWQVAGHDEAALATLAAPLAAAPRRPVVVQGDLLEQSYRKETVPQLNPVDRGKMLRRRLERAFADAPLKAALKLADDPEEPRRRNYLLVGAPSAPDWDSWLDFLRSIANPVTSLTLLPVEAADLVTRLAQALTPADRKPSDWAMLVSRQHTGGFRQIVVHRGELALTRLTPGMAADATPAELAAEIRQELKATLGYMTRLGYRAGSSMDVVILGEDDLRSQLETAQALPGQRFVVTAAAAARALGIHALDDLEGADGVLLAAFWLGRKRRPALQLLPADLRTRRLQGEALRWATAGLAASALGLLSYSALSAASGLEIEQEVRWLNAWQGTTRQQLERSEGEIDAIGARADAMRALLEAHRRLGEDRLDPFEALLALRGAMTREEQLAALTWQLVAGPEGQRGAPAHGADYALELTLDLGAVRDPGAAVAATEDLAGRLAEAFPERPVAITRQAVAILPDQAFVGGSDLAESEADERLSAELWVGAKTP